MNPEREPKDTEALRYGKAMHALLFEMSEFEARFVILPDEFNGRTSEGKDLVASIKERGQLPLKGEEYRKLLAMRDVVLRDEIAAASFSNGLFEPTLAWKDPETGIWLRSRLDFLPEQRTWIPDYKTSTSSDPGPNGFGKSCAGYGYYIQAAVYLEGIERVFGERPKGFYFVVQEKEPPYVVSAIPLSTWQLDMGWREMRRAIERWADCLERDHWPGYVEEPTEARFPAYAEIELQRRYENELAVEMNAP
jgi:hypothetical protein